MSYLQRLHTFFEKIETGILILMLVSMLLVAVIQISLRNFFDFGFIWAETFVRLMVLWTTLVGAMLASKQNKHIKIDLFSHWLGEQSKKATATLVNLFTALICATVAYYSYQFVLMEYEDGGYVLEYVPAWACEAIIPFAFFIMAVRYFIFFVSLTLPLFSRK